ncbi:hypothetical protein [Bradyrhizobium sp. sBnM-33]|uniref:hypothetical protein n=1 Tax=Bradyrhizobium sp. sBnM-33 TaxID=2831780 RepID=UPI000D39D106|nr:hypothetical protein [Bradyrhizobium sp. sBnM-33]WOH52846.1 hypothetical protein RX328_12520 [Bradyrhizobium sp. sBnM-33]
MSQTLKLTPQGPVTILEHSPESEVIYGAHGELAKLQPEQDEAFGTISISDVTRAAPRKRWNAGRESGPCG